MVRPRSAASSEEPPSRIAWLIEEDSTGFGRMVSNWRAGLSLTERGAATIAAADTFRPSNLLVRAMRTIIRRKFHRTQQPILAALKESLET